MEQIEAIVREINQMLGDAYARFQEVQIAQTRYAIEGELRAAQTGNKSFDKRAKLIQTAIKSQ